MTGPYYAQHWIDIDSERLAAYEKLFAFHPAMEPMLKPLELAPGLSVLDVGSGPGQMALELARRVGPTGRVVGVDINAEFVKRANARGRQEGLSAEFIRSAFPPLGFTEASFDRVWCKNVLEYMDSASAAVVEMVRVAAPGARVVAVDSDWEMIALETGPAGGELNERVLAAAKAVALKEPRIGRRLYGLFRAAGLEEVKVKVLAGADTTGRTLPALRASFARYALDSGKIAASEIEQWLAQIDRAIECGTFLFMLPQFVASGTRGGSGGLGR